MEPDRAQAILAGDLENPSAYRADPSPSRFPYEGLEGFVLYGTRQGTQLHAGSPAVHGSISQLRAAST
jgi:hypothetical protein